MLRGLSALPFVLTIGLSGFLIFQVQPIMGKFLLPVFGGSVATWSVCIAFFQTALLGGYLYAHGLSFLPRRTQAIVQIAVLALSLLLLPVTPNASAGLAESSQPALQIMLLLAATVGAPYMLLATTSSLIQRWFGVVSGGADPTRLFAVSNFASFAGLLSYPFLFERIADTTTQTRWWSWGFALYALMFAACALVFLRAAKPDDDEPTAPGARAAHAPDWRPAAVVIGLSFIGSVLLLATTNLITERIAAVPFLWIIPLSLYLLTFTMVFANANLIPNAALLAAFILLFALGLLLQNVENALLLITKVAALSGAMFFGCAIVHAEMARRRPEQSRLTGYYLAMTFGGALGGLFVTFAAPAIFTDYWEYELATICAIAIGLLVWRGQAGSLMARLPRPAFAGALAAAAVLVVGLTVLSRDEAGHLEYKVRNFYGVLKVMLLDEDDDDERMALVQSSVNQGEQMTDPARSREPACDFGEKTGLGLALLQHPKRRQGQPLRVGVVGLGVGMALAHGKSGDAFRYYEINPAVADIARQRFTFIKDSPATTEIALGDGRLVLEQEGKAGAAKFDVLIIDAFRGAAPPMHLMTKEAFDIYLSRLNPDGLLVANFEVERFDPSPLFRGMGALFNLDTRWFETTLLPDCKEEAVSWAIYARNSAFFDAPEVKAQISAWPDRKDTRITWTDQTSNLFSIINW